MLVGRWRRVETWLRDEATPGERAASEAAVCDGLAHLGGYRELTDLVRHFWEDPKWVAPAPGEIPRLVEPPWIAEARCRHGGEHDLSTMAIEALAYGRRRGEIDYNYLGDLML